MVLSLIPQYGVNLFVPWVYQTSHVYVASAQFEHCPLSQLSIETRLTSLLDSTYYLHMAWVTLWPKSRKSLYYSYTDHKLLFVKNPSYRFVAATAIRLFRAKYFFSSEKWRGKKTTTYDMSSAVRTPSELCPLDTRIECQSRN